MTNGLAKETQRGGGGIPSGGQRKIYVLPRAVDGAIQVFPLPSYFDVRLIHAPAACHGPFMSAKYFIQ